jgi:hypothetical protein
MEECFGILMEMFQHWPYCGEWVIYLQKPIHLNFTKGQLIFSLFFVIVFVIGLVWAYGKDKAIRSTYFKGVAPRLILVIVAVYSLIFLIIKLMH